MKRFIKGLGLAAVVAVLTACSSVKVKNVLLEPLRDVAKAEKLCGSAAGIMDVEYNSDGQRVKETYDCDSDGKPNTSIETSYDLDGRVSMVMVCNYAGTAKTQCTSEYKH